MAGTTDFVPFATGTGANVTSQADYIAESTTTTGFEPGVARSADCNKVWRQATFQASVVANLVAATMDINVADDGNLSNGVTNLTNAINSLASTQATSVVGSALGSLTLPFTKITGTIANAQVPESAVVQYEGNLSISFSQITGTIANAQVPESAVTQYEADLSIGADQLTGNVNAYSLQSFVPATTPTASTVALRTSSGYLYATYLNQSSSESENPTIGQIWVESTAADGFLRKASFAYVQSQMSLSSIGGTLSAGQVPVGAVTQYEGDLEISGSQISGAIPAASVPSSFSMSGTITLTSRGQVLIGENGTGIYLNYTDGYSYYDAEDGFYFRVGSDTEFTLNSSTATFNVTINRSSDAKLKERVKPVEDALDAVCAMQGMHFTWSRTQVRSSGVIAQHLLRVAPQLVTMGEDGFLSVNYDGLAAYFIEAIKKERAAREQAEAHLVEIETRLAALEVR